MKFKLSWEIFFTGDGYAWQKGWANPGSSLLFHKSINPFWFIVFSYWTIILTACFPALHSSFCGGNGKSKQGTPESILSSIWNCWFEAITNIYFSTIYYILIFLTYDKINYIFSTNLLCISTFAIKATLYYGRGLYKLI